MSEITANQKLHLVTGKGGVGKSTVAAGLALNLSQKGEKTLLVELGERSFYSSAWGQEFGFEPTSVEPNLWVARWQAEDCLKEYLGHLLKVSKIAELFFENRVMKALVNSAPALKELAIAGKLTSRPRKVGPPLGFEHIVLDAYSTGHFRALLNAPIGMAEAVGFGPMGEQSRGITDTLKRRDITKIYVVTLPEELPVKETLELDDYLTNQYGQETCVIMNKSLHGDFQLDEVKILSEEVVKTEAPGSSRKYLEYLETRLTDERDFRNQLPEGVHTLEHQYKPTSKDLYLKVAESLSEVVDA
ncbi:MAG: ArsA family ATPase [Bdellovibrionales bacterium]|nr:ArsA family ATPase [Bdellovibrionales bacterium]